MPTTYEPLNYATAWENIEYRAPSIRVRGATSATATATDSATITATDHAMSRAHYEYCVRLQTRAASIQTEFDLIDEEVPVPVSPARPIPSTRSPNAIDCSVDKDFNTGMISMIGEAHVDVKQLWRGKDVK